MNRFLFSQELLGGLIAETFDWRWVFLLMAPIGALSALLAVVSLGDQERGTSGRIGYVGFIALAVCMSSAQLMMDRGHRLRETSRFRREGGRWLYVDGIVEHR